MGTKSDYRNDMGENGKEVVGMEGNGNQNIISAQALPLICSLRLGKSSVIYLFKITAKGQY